MLIRTGLGGQLSGSVGGVTAARNRYGQYLRNRTVPVNPNSDRQQLVRACMSECAIAWRSLTTPQRNAWNAYADQTPVLNRLGESITLTGQAMFNKTNVWLQAAGEAALLDAPNEPGLASLNIQKSDVSIEAVGPAVDIATAGSATRAVLQIGPPVSDGITFFKGPYCFVAYEAIVANAFTPTFPVNVPYGTLVAATRRPIRITGMDAVGRTTNAIEYLITIG